MTDVYISKNSETRSSHGTYHTDPDCHHVEAESVLEKPLEQVSDRMGLSQCKHCSGEVDNSHTGSTLAYEVLNSE